MDSPNQLFAAIHELEFFILEFDLNHIFNKINWVENITYTVIEYLIGHLRLWQDSHKICCQWWKGLYCIWWEAFHSDISQ